MGRWYIPILILLFLGGLAFLFVQKSIAPTAQTQSVVPSPTPTESGQASAPTYCVPKQLQTMITLSHGAGNVYGTFTLKNISQQTCRVMGGQFISANYNSAVKNISVSYTGQTQTNPFVLSPGQMIYSQVHYPNGPQCQSIGLTETPVIFTYNVSAQTPITFQDETGNMHQIVESCKSPTNITEIQIWNMSTSPITP